MVWQRSVQSVLHPGQHAIVVVMFFSHMESAMPREDNIGLPSLTAVTRAERGGAKGSSTGCFRRTATRSSRSSCSIAGTPSRSGMISAQGCIASVAAHSLGCCLQHCCRRCWCGSELPEREQPD